MAARAAAQTPDDGAVRYALNQCEPLSVFAADQRAAIDNTFAQREMKRIAINRKNSLFVGNQRGGETMAVLASLTSTCRRHGIDHSGRCWHVAATPSKLYPQRPHRDSIGVD